MKPRTAEELAAWSAQGVDAEICDRLGLSPERIAKYKREYPEEVKRNAYCYSHWRFPREKEVDPLSEMTPDGRLIHNPNPIDKRYNND